MNTNWIRLGMFGSLALLLGCDAGEHSKLAEESGAGGATGPTTTSTGSGTTTTTGGGGSSTSPVSGLPVPPGSDTEPPPSGAAGGLKVLPWAGFTAAVTYTFDDAQPSQIQYWPTLEAEGIRGTSATPEASGGATTWTWTLPNHFPPGKFVRVTVTGGTLTQGAQTLTWNSHGFYEVALDAGTLTLSP